MDGNEMAEMLLKKKKVGSIKKIAKTKKKKRGKRKIKTMKRASVMAGGY